MSRRRVHVIALFVALALVASETVLLEARPPSVRTEVEGNDTAASATPLGISRSYGMAIGAIGSPGDVDYWSFQAASFIPVSILCDTGGVQGAGASSRQVIVELIGTAGQTVAVDSGDGTGNGGDGTIETIDAAAIGPTFTPSGGTYYIRISGLNPTDTVSPYRLFLVLSALPMAEQELNNDAAAAKPIAAPVPIGARLGAINTPGDVDYFSVRAAAGDVLFAAVANHDTIGEDLVLDLLAPDGVTQLLSLDSAPAPTSFFNQSTESANFLIPTSGLYFLRVRDATGSGTGRYLLMAAARPFSDALADLDGDAHTELALFGPGGLWTIFRSSDSRTSLVSWGSALADIPVPADYDGDGMANVAVYRGTTGDWNIRTPTGQSTLVAWGTPSLGDIPIPGDYDGDRKYDVAVYRRSTGEWLIRFAAGGAASFQWGAAWLEDVAVPADYDGDGTTDVAVYRNATGQWFFAYSGGGFAVADWGAPWLGDVPVPGDYDGDGRADIAVYRRSTGGWFIRYAAGGAAWYSWGAAASEDMPVPGDYDGDGLEDPAVYRPGTGTFYLRGSNFGGFIMTFQPGSVPVNRSSAVRVLFP